MHSSHKVHKIWKSGGISAPQRQQRLAAGLVCVFWCVHSVTLPATNAVWGPFPKWYLSQQIEHRLEPFFLVSFLRCSQAITRLTAERELLLTGSLQERDMVDKPALTKAPRVYPSYCASGLNLGVSVKSGDGPIVLQNDSNPPRRTRAWAGGEARTTHDGNCRTHGSDGDACHGDHPLRLGAPTCQTFFAALTHSRGRCCYLLRTHLEQPFASTAR